MNEHELVLFHNNHIIVHKTAPDLNTGLEEDEHEQSETDINDCEDDNESVNSEVLEDIFSENHAWDSVKPFLSYRFKPDIWCNFLNETHSFEYKCNDFDHILESNILE